MRTGTIRHVDLTVSDLDRVTRFDDRVLPLLGFTRALDVPEGPARPSRSGCPDGSPISRHGSRAAGLGLYVIARIILVDSIAAAGIASVAFAAFWSLWWLLPHLLQRAGSH